MPLEIKHKDTGEIRFTIDLKTFRGVDLTDFDLNFYFDFDFADLKGFDFTGANLRTFGFQSADLTGAIMKDANLSFADFSNADMTNVDLTGANMTRIILSNANMTGIKYGPEIPVIANIDKKILEAIQQYGNRLDMTNWHKCGTTHCRGGWAIFLAGKAGKALERKFGVETAATLIYAASRPDKPFPDFFVSNEEAMADIIACAA